jgi:hypothetical protein
MTWPEVKRLNNAMHFMELHCRQTRSRLWWASTDSGTARSMIANIQKRITKLQGAHNLPRYNATTFETRGGLHVHITYIGNTAIAKRLKTSSAFGECIEVDRVTDQAIGMANTVTASGPRPLLRSSRNSVLC